jgi:hypothetical protein
MSSFTVNTKYSSPEMIRKYNIMNWLGEETVLTIMYNPKSYIRCTILSL